MGSTPPETVIPLSRFPLSFVRVPSPDNSDAFVARRIESPHGRAAQAVPMRAGGDLVSGGEREANAARQACSLLLQVVKHPGCRHGDETRRFPPQVPAESPGEGSPAEWGGPPQDSAFRRPSVWAFCTVRGWSPPRAGRTTCPWSTQGRRQPTPSRRTTCRNRIVHILLSQGAVKASVGRRPKRFRGGRYGDLLSGEEREANAALRARGQPQQKGGVRFPGQGVTPA